MAYTDNIRHNKSDNSESISNAARKNTNEQIRVLDLDQYQYCRKCLQVTAVIEATSANSSKSVLMIRKLAEQLGATAIFVRHEWEDTKLQHPIYLAVWAADGTEYPLKRSTWNGYNLLQVYCQTVHEKLTGCSRKPSVFHKGAYPKISFDSRDYVEADRQLAAQAQ